MLTNNSGLSNSDGAQSARLFSKWNLTNAVPSQACRAPDGPFARNQSWRESGDNHRGAHANEPPPDRAHQLFIRGPRGAPANEPAKSNERPKLFLLDAVEIVDQRQNLGSYVSFLIVGNIDVVLGCVD